MRRPDPGVKVHVALLPGRMRGSLATLQKLVDAFPDDVGLRNDLGVAHLLLGDNKGAKKVYEEVRRFAQTFVFRVLSSLLIGCVSFAPPTRSSPLPLATGLPRFTTASS